MAEGRKNEDNGGSWWSSWMAAAKEKTEKAFEMMSNDIAEFTSTMQSDTKKVVEKTKETLQQSNEREGGTMTDKMTTSFHSLMEGITKALTVEPEDKAPTKPQIPHPATGIFDRAKARLRAIQTDTGTYLNEPSGPPEQYAEWLKSFNLDAHKGEISDLLVSMVEVRSLYTTLVPSEVSHQDFWGRYFYKLHQLDRDEARKQALMQRAERANIKEDSISWDEEWSGDEESGSPEASKQKSKHPSGLKEYSPKLTDKNQPEQGRDEDLKSRLNPSISEDSEGKKIQQEGKQPTDTVYGKISQEAAVSKKDETVSKVKQKSPDKIDPTDKQVDQHSEVDPNKLHKAESDNETSVNEDIGQPKNEKQNAVDLSNGCDEAVESDTQPDESEDKNEPKVCDKTEKAEESCTESTGLKSNVKGDTVVVGEGDRISPTSESSSAKESSTDDWEKDFDVDITPEDLAAASELAQKMNTSAADYNTLTGVEDDWENWE